MNDGLSVCIIGKDEEDNLPRCLNSVKPIANEIIYVDTGSKDKSIEICKKSNCRVFRKVFNCDFADIRNYSIKFAEYKWILIIDCDEELDKVSFDEINNIIKNGYFEGYYILVENIIDNTANDRFYALRLFKNRKEFNFKCRIHEEIKTSIVNVAGDKAIATTSIKLLHHGYYESDEKELIKHKRNMEIYNSISDNLKDSRYYYNLGNEYGRYKNFENAIKSYSTAKDLITDNEVSINKNLNERLAYCYFIIGKYQLCINECKKALETDFSYAYLYYLMGLSYLNQMRFTKANKVFLELLEVDATNENSDGLIIRDIDKINYTISEINGYGFKECHGLLTTIIECQNDDIDLDTIRSVSEISSEIIVLGNNLDIGYKDVIYFRILGCDIKSKYLLEEIKSKYILYLKNGEGISFYDQIYINQLLIGNKFNHKSFTVNGNLQKVRLVSKEDFYMLDKTCSDNDNNFIIYNFR